MAEGQEKQVPGIYKRRIGEAMVTTVNDGFLDIPFEILRGISPSEMRGVMRDAFHEGAPRITVNAFVIENGDRTILVDAGGGSTTVYSMGLLLDNLRTLGLTPADIDTVLLTHIHPDHSNGLLDADGKAMFPRAQIIVNEADVAFWSDPGLSGGRVPAATPYLASALALLAAYRDQIRPSRDGIVAPGLSMLSLPGHTPGHSGYSLESAGETLMIWGDTVHVPELQVPHPVVTSEFDIDEGQAAESRRRLFDLVARERTLVAGMHLHVPAFAHLVKSGEGYRLVPEPWAVTL
ncbi:MAG TPA: MBL fold metallo-hydrolase [Lichenihabitans sp.]|jgi:glyoxylase-like metal-dependent hydrolase (beta-lactamase superfamily II)|nr:MBL fold metallo-hydrolase [Lichenihabitans sp.]